MDSLNEAHVFITGGASGIGLGFARAAASHGARIAITDIREDHLEEARAIAAKEGWHNRAVYLKLDVADRPGFARAMDEAEKALGPLRVLVNNAGVGIDGPVADAGFADWDWALSVNLGGVTNGLVVGMPRLRAHGKGGHVINTSSMAAVIPARPGRGLYAATKAALVLMSEHLQLELADENIGVSVLCPGAVKSNIHESGFTRPPHLRKSSNFLQREVDLARRKMQPEWLDPLDLGHMMVKAILTNTLYIFSHPEILPRVKLRHEAIEAALEEQARGSLMRNG
jgi:NAD(P)-dependent dehydrogenase (short-subunit alcohol dehydrogenase family)